MKEKPQEEQTISALLELSKSCSMLRDSLVLLSEALKDYQMMTLGSEDMDEAMILLKTINRRK